MSIFKTESRKRNKQNNTEEYPVIYAKSEKKWKYDVSFLCVSYNSDFETIKTTLASFLCQRGVSFEVVVADDGSKDNHKQEIEDFFRENGFFDYKLILNSQNGGTVKNYISGLEVAEGKYCKGLGPGDYLHDENIIKNWVSFLEKSGAEWSFSDAIYYREGSNERVSVKANPQDLEPYFSNNNQRKRWNYIVLNDIAVGAAIIGKTDLQKHYSLKIARKGVKYAEDNMWRLMMFEGIVPVYYSKPTIYYEHGGGISTRRETVWEERLSHDWNMTDEIMKEYNNPDKFQIKMLHNMKIQHNILGKIFTKGKIRRKIKNILNLRMTPVD